VQATGVPVTLSNAPEVPPSGYRMTIRPGEIAIAASDRAGAVHVLEYEMIATEKGWLINGVRLIEPPGVGA